MTKHDFFFFCGDVTLNLFPSVNVLFFITNVKYFFLIQLTWISFTLPLTETHILPQKRTNYINVQHWIHHKAWFMNVLTWNVKLEVLLFGFIMQVQIVHEEKKHWQSVYCKLFSNGHRKRPCMENKIFHVYKKRTDIVLKQYGHIQKKCVTLRCLQLLTVHRTVYCTQISRPYLKK